MLRKVSFLFCIFVCTLAGAPPTEGSHSLLEEAVEKWLGERDHWAFTQRAVEYENGTPHVRLERYDPSKRGDARWTLLAINGKFPTLEQHAAWAKKKFKKQRRRFDMPIGDFFAFDEARVLSETDKLVRYDLPLRNDRSWLFQADKVQVVVTVNKQTRALEHLNADIDEPVKVLLGLARITEGELDLSFLNFDNEAAPDPKTTEPTGRVRVTVRKFGERVEFTWSDFKRVKPATAGLARKDD